MTLPIHRLSSGKIFRLMGLMRVGIAAFTLLAAANPSGLANAAQNDAELCLKGTGDPSELVDACTRALDSWFTFGQSSDSIRAARAFHYIDLERPTDAIKDLNIVLKSHPRWARSLNDRCLAYLMINEYQKAEKDCKDAISVDPEAAYPYRNLGQIYMNMRQYGRAEDILDTYISRRPTDAAAIALRGEVKEKRRDFAGAKLDYRKAVRLNSKLTVAKEGLARLENPEVERKAAALPALPGPPAVATQAPAPQVAAVPSEPGQSELTRRLQGLLRELGYDVGALNGRVGAKTRNAISQFASEVGLPPGGEPSEELLAAAEDALRRRDVLETTQQHELNRRAQQALVALGYDIGAIDGVIGGRSSNALRMWSTARGQSTATVDEQLVASLEAAVLERQTPAPTNAPPEQSAAAAAPPASVKVSEGIPSRMAGPTDAPAGPSTMEESTAGHSAPETLATRAEPPVTHTADGYDIIAPASEAPESRVALVIGNANYQETLPLVNPINDADDMAVALSELGFEVLKGVDLSRERMRQITRDFARKARLADIALAYYSGHGMQFENVNYLLPVDGRVQDEFDLRDTLQLDQVIQDSGRAKRLSLVVVDACRDDPLATKALAQSLGSSRSTGLSQGLAIPKLPPSQSLIAYATRAGFVAYDGGNQARNSPFTAALLKFIKTPKLDVGKLFGKVADEVRLVTGGAQRPDKWDSLGGEPIYLLPGPPDPVGLEMADLTEGEVLLIQGSLKSLKLWSGADDGIATPELTLAVREWQRSQFAEQTGSMTPQQVIALSRIAGRDRPRQPLPEFKVDEVFGRAFGGEIEALRVMGMVYDPAFADAPSFKKDRATARSFYEKAAAQGDVPAAGLLGAMLVAADNPNPDDSKGPQWLEMAAKGGDSGAALRLAEYVVEHQPDVGGRTRAIQFLKIAAADPSTSGMANVWLRYVGQPVAQ